MSDKITVVVSDERHKEIDQLMADTILQDMCIGLRDVPDSEIMSGDGEPLWNFMQSANERYRKLGGQHGQFIGSVAWAIITIRQERGRCHVPAYLEPYLILIDRGDEFERVMQDESLSLRSIAQGAPTQWAQFELLRRLSEARLLKPLGEKA